jgi:Uma2 family endonuclease
LFDSDFKIRVPETGLATYPDLSVICGAIQPHPEDPHAATNPTALFEVLSESTEDWDRGGKFAHCRTMPALQHYVLVRTDRIGVEHYRRQADGSWRLTDYGHGDTLDLDGISVSYPVEALYRNLPAE